MVHFEFFAAADHPRLAELFLFVPLLDRINLQKVVTAARLPGSKMSPATQAVASLLALKLMGAQRDPARL